MGRRAKGSDEAFVQHTPEEQQPAVPCEHWKIFEVGRFSAKFHKGRQSDKWSIDPRQNGGEFLEDIDEPTFRVAGMLVDYSRNLPD